MSKTASTVLSIAALLGAAGAGAAFYFVHEEQMATAMKRTEWLDSKADAINKAESKDDVDNPDFIPGATDEKTRDGSVFVKRMYKIEHLKAKLDAKREKVIAQHKVIDERDATIRERDATIVAKNESITTLESEKADLTRDRDTLRGNLNSANSKVRQLEDEKAQNQAEILRLNNDMKDESKYMPRERYDEEVKAKRKQEDDVAKASRQYTDLWNWTAIHSTERIPGKYPRTINFNVATVADPIPAPVRGATTIATKIVTVDLGKGMLGFVLARDSEGIVKPDAYFNVHINGENVGKIRLLEVRPNNLSIAEILPGAQMVRFTRDSQVTLVPTQTIIKAPVRPAPAAPATATPAAPATDGIPPPPPAL